MAEALVVKREQSIAYYIHASWTILGGRRDRFFQGKVDSKLGHSLCLTVSVGFPDVREVVWTITAPDAMQHSITGAHKTIYELKNIGIETDEALDLMSRTLDDLYSAARREFKYCAENFAPLQLNKNVDAWKILDAIFKDLCLATMQKHEAVVALSAIRADCLASWKTVGKNKFIGRMRQRVEEALAKLGESPQ
jgi:hypothetical protein